VRARLALALALPLAAAAAAQTAPPPQQGSPREYTLRNAHGTVVRFLDYGATITAIEVPDRNGRRANVVLAYRAPADYPRLNHKNGFGATIGRYAGRIAGARFTLDGREYRLQANDGPNALHGGGLPGLAARTWTVQPFREGAIQGARLRFTSPDGDQGFPGALSLTVTYRLLADDALRIDYQARTTRPTVLNLTNHSYFNLAGSGPVTGQRLRIAASRWIETGAGGIPTGRLAPVAGTPLDFRDAHAIGERIDHKGPPMAGPGGYNHAWAFDAPARGVRPVIWLSDPASGRTLTVETDAPSVQAYTGDYFDGADRDGQGRTIRPRDGIALETQGFADAPNRPGFPSTRLAPGQVFRQTAIWRFGTTRQ